MGFSILLSGPILGLPLHDIDHLYRIFERRRLHQFEALLFSDPDIMQEWLSIDEPSIRKGAFQKILTEFKGNPEMINDSRQTAPSKRILEICTGYDKVLHSEIILEDIGLTQIREKCPHFNSWLTKLEELGDKLSAPDRSPGD